jgi:outer membrane receptor protein involved in Fe transport
MLYATWSRGSKSGGYQTNPQTLAAAPYDGETAYTAEIGAKLDLTGSSYVTAAVFNTYVKDFQVSRTQVINGLSQAVIANADVRTRGAEVAGAWAVTESLTLNGNVVYADAKFAKDFPPAPAPMIAYEGMPLPRAPKLTARFGAEYLKDLTDDLELRLQGSASYTSDSDLQFRSTDPLSPIAEAHWLLDAQVAIGSLKNGWEVSFIGTNLADERYVVFATNVSAGGSSYYGNLNRPRTVAVQLRLTR